jgi:hypothetical protein
MTASTVAGPPEMDVWLPAAEEYYSPPADDFKAAGSWKNSYVMLDSAAVRGGSKLRAEGFLTISRRGLPNGEKAGLEVGWLLGEQYFGAFAGSARISCLADRLGTPVAWALKSVSLDTKGKPVEVTRVEERAEVKDGRIVREGRGAGNVKLPGAYTSNWSLFDAVQRLGGREIEPVEFDMIEDLDLVKPGQRLTYWGTTEVELGGRTVRLTGYRQIGRGILPYHYWLDESGRLIMAHGGLRGFIFNPAAAEMFPAVGEQRRKN